MYPQTAFYYRQTAPNGGGGSNKLSDHFNQQKRDPRFAGNKSRGFVRLDSLDGSCHTIPSRHNSKMDTADQKISPSEKESKWFGYQPQHFQQPAYSEYPPYWPADYQHQQFYWPQPYQNHYQVPFNLNKGQYELWQMEPVQSIEHHGHSALSATSLQSAVPMFDQQAQNGTTFTRCVNYIFGTVGTVIASAFSTTTSLSSPSSASSVSSADSFQSPPRSLNPNARVFTPLNPNAKEFRPAAAKSDPPHDVPEDQEPEPVTPPNEEEVQLKAVSYRKCTPWIPKGSVVKDESGLLDSTEEEVIAHEDEDSEDDSDDEDDDAYENSRQRLLSVCSSEDNFIQFEAESPKEPRKLENCSKFLKDFIAGHSDSDDDDGQEGDDDWDSTVDAIFIDDEDILEQCGLQCQWMIEAPKIQTSVGDRLQDDEDDDQVDHHKPKEFPTTIDRELMLAKIRDANEQWKNMEGMKKSNIKVAFYEPVVTGVLEEDPELASDLRSARVSDFAQRKADTERLLRLLTPIFSEEHRSKMRTYIQSYLK